MIEIPDIAPNFSSLVGLLRYRALYQSEQLAFTFLQDEAEASWNYRELDRRSRAIAAQLQALGASGERALLLYPSGLDYLAAFFGCLYAGVVAVPAYPPRNQRNTPRIQAIAKDAQAAIALSTTAILSQVRSLLTSTTDSETLQWLTTDNLARNIEDCWQEPTINSDNIAFLQYTSGSTGTPKGAILTHGNLLHNAAMTYHYMGHSPSSKFVSWLPTYHDMGLIGGILQPLYGGFPCIMMAPASFLQRPYRWLQAISRYQATTSGGPNFAYEICIEKITPQQRETLDLSSWSVAFNGAEPVRAETLERFAATFACCGFRPSAFYPCYGMAEATLMVSGGLKTAPSPCKTLQKQALASNRVIETNANGEDACTLVSCGRTLPEQQIAIAHPESLTCCLPAEVGEIWVKGPSVGRGYWHRPEETQQTFHAYLSDTGEGPFLRTGDLGFLDNGELFITGRLKDLIIIRGRNLYPQDIELTAERSHPALRAGSNAAFAVEVGNEERLVVVQELEFRAKPNLESVTAAIRQAIAVEHELQAYAVVLIKPGSIPKTSSGKIQRRACRADFLAGNLSVITSSVCDRVEMEGDEYSLTRQELLAGSDNRQQRLETYLQHQIARLLKVVPSQIDCQQPLSRFGVDSLMVFEMKNQLELDFGVDVAVTDLFAGASIAWLATQILSQIGQTECLPVASIDRVQRTTAYPLSFAQQRFWFLEQFEPGHCAYNEPFALRLEGRLNLDILCRSMNEIVQRHEILRTTFTTVAGQAVQAIAPHVNLSLPVVDLQEFSQTQKPQELQRLITRVLQQPFDLTQAPLLRITLLQLDKAEYILLLVAHHIIADGWSMKVFIQELTALYTAFSHSQPSPLPKLPIQYADFAVWQRQLLQGEFLAGHLAYFKRHLGSELPILELPVDRPRSAIQTFKGATQSLILPQALAKAVKALSRREQVTLFMTLLAAFKTLLYRYTSQEDILVGSPIANRSRIETKGLIGVFINTLVFRTNLAGNPSFRQLLERVRSVTLAAYEYRDLPFEKLLEELQPERNLSQTPLFQVGFDLQQPPISTVNLPDLTVSYWEVQRQTAKLDLTLYMVDSESGLIANLEYNTDLFETATIARMLEHFQILLEGIVTDPDRCLSELPILTAAEREKILVEWNNTQTDYPQDCCIHQLFADRARRTPDAVAVVFADRELTYQELDRRANQLARYLHGLGIKPEAIVGIYMERSVELVVAILGVLKAGGAYLPLDRAYPKQRLTFMLEDARISVLLTQQHLVEELLHHQARVVCLDSDEAIARESASDLEIEVKADNLAYLLYTSGSTGKPKGVMVQHGGLVNAYFAWEEAYQLRAGNCHLQMASFSFDVFSGDLVRALCSGGKLVLCPREVLLEPAALYTLMRQHQIDCAEFVPAVLRNLIQYLESGQQKLDFMRLLICGSDSWYVGEYKKFRQFCGDRTRLINSFGLTEATIDSTYYDSEVVDLPVEQLVPIGRPFANTQLYILDSHLQPVPIGVRGELYICSPGLARGYFNRPDLTAARFIEKSKVESQKLELIPDSRLYKTGDLARWLPDGNVELLGRIDNLEKIRGYRIELGEIEATLSQHPAVQNAVVQVREDSPGDKRLVAYLVQNPQYLAGETSSSRTDLAAEQISQWQMVYDSEERLFQQLPVDWNPTFNISGWNSSYSGLPIPATEMQAWVDRTVERILALKPTRVLEIGCGTGLLLFRIAPHCQQYWGMDFSPAALGYIQNVLARPEYQLPQVTLLQRTADNFEGIEKQAFNTVVINSVIQHFPSVDYLLQVLTRAVDVVEPGGSIFLGDVRSLPLLKAFHASVELYKSPDGRSLDQLRQCVQQQIVQEEELAIEPAFFIALQQHLPQISRVQIQPKRGRDRNEMTKFRYDVTLHIGTVTDTTPEIPWLDWQQQQLTLNSVRQLLRSDTPKILGITGIPNARLLEDVKILELLTHNFELQTVNQLQQALQDDTPTGIEPEDLWSLSQDLPYAIHISWSNSSVDGSYDVVFQHSSTVSNIPIQIPTSKAAIRFQPLSTYTNNPLQGKLGRELVPQLRQYLQEKLPEYMVPSAFVTLEALPLLPNGKLNRRILPAPDPAQQDWEVAYVAPRNSVEERLTKIWADVLRLERVGIHDNFFRLGGHSLLATQVISQVRETLQVELPLRQMFESPTVKELADRLPVADPKQTKAVPPIERFSRNAPLPLSFNQQRLLFLDRLQPGNPAYNIPIAVRFRGALQAIALEQSLNEIIRRHEILRTTFTTLNGRPVQVIAPELSLKLPLVDLQALPETERQARVMQLATREAQRPFDLAEAPLLRGMLLRLDVAEHLLLFTMHHIVTDGWSMGVLIHELTAIYTAGDRDRSSQLPELPIQYADFALWQRQWLQQEVLETQLDYWKQQLQGASTLLQLPTDYPRSADQTFRGARQTLTIPQPLSQALYELSRREGVTLFMTLLAAFKVLLHHYSQQEDILVGSPIANRDRAEVEGLIGFFVNTLVLRTDLSGNPSFRELLGRVRQTALGAYAHQDLPFERLVSELQLERRSHNPLFQVWFVLQNTPISALELPGLSVDVLSIDSGTTRHDLNLNLTETSNGIDGFFEYKTDLFDAATIAKMVQMFELVLNKVASQSDIKLNTLKQTLLKIEKQQQFVQEQEFKQARRQKLENLKRRDMSRNSIDL